MHERGSKSHLTPAAPPRCLARPLSGFAFRRMRALSWCAVRPARGPGRTRLSTPCAAAAPRGHASAGQYRHIRDGETAASSRTGAICAPGPRVDEKRALLAARARRTPRLLQASLIAIRFAGSTGRPLGNLSASGREFTLLAARGLA